MLDYDMGQRGELGLAEYLYRRIRDDVVSGAIGPDDKLPSKRALAQHLGVSVITVEGAYAQLVAEGYVRAESRRGFYANELPRRPQQTMAGRTAPSRVEVPVPLKLPLVADLSRSRPPTEWAARLWTRALRRTLAQEPDSELFAEQGARGTLRLRRAIARWLRETRGMEVDPACVVVGAGAQLLYAQIAQLVGRERPIAVEDPGYPRLTQVYEANGAAVCHLPLDEGGVAMEGLRASGAGVLHIMPSHQFPTGRVTTVARRYEIMAWAAETDAYVVEDDYDCEFRMAGRPISSLASMDGAGRVIYESTLTKSLSSALRLAYLVLPPELSERYDRELGFYSCTVSVVDQVVLARLLESGEYERHVSRYRNRCRGLRDAFIDELEMAAGECGLPMPHDLRVEEADSGLHFVLSLAVPAGVDAVALEHAAVLRALEQGVRVAPLSSFAQEPQHATLADGRARLLVQYDSLTTDVARKAARVLAEAVAACM